MSGFLEALGLKWVTLAPGFIGAIISLKFVEGLGLWQRTSTVIAGALVAAYCTPLAVDILSLSPKMEGAIAFLGGLFGMSIAGALMKAIPEWVAAVRARVVGGGS